MRDRYRTGEKSEATIWEGNPKRKRNVSELSEEQANGGRCELENPGALEAGGENISEMWEERCAHEATDDCERRSCVQKGEKGRCAGRRVGRR